MPNFSITFFVTIAKGTYWFVAFFTSSWDSPGAAGTGVDIFTTFSGSGISGLVFLFARFVTFVNEPVRSIWKP
jgi:hypothetical protein